MSPRGHCAATVLVTRAAKHAVPEVRTTNSFWLEESGRGRCSGWKSGVNLILAYEHRHDLVLRLNQANSSD